MYGPSEDVAGPISSFIPQTRKSAYFLFISYISEVISCDILCVLIFPLKYKILKAAGQSRFISLTSVGGSITQSHPSPPLVSLRIFSSNEQVHSRREWISPKFLESRHFSTCFPPHSVGQIILLALNLKYTQEKKATSVALIHVSLPILLFGYLAPAASLVPFPYICLLWSVHGQAAVQKPGHSSTRILQ